MKMYRRRRTKRKKNKIKYNFISDTIQNLGTTEDPCRTTITHWLVYKEHQNKKISFDIDFSSKYHEFDFCLELNQKNKTKVYKYNGEIINRQKFILLLGCET
jgi:hypothetical protein